MCRIEGTVWGPTLILRGEVARAGFQVLSSITRDSGAESVQIRTRSSGGSLMKFGNDVCLNFGDFRLGFCFLDTKREAGVGVHLTRA